VRGRWVRPYYTGTRKAFVRSLRPRSSASIGSAEIVFHGAFLATGGAGASGADQREVISPAFHLSQASAISLTAS
jgi:hypothetical protein